MRVVDLVFNMYNTAYSNPFGLAAWVETWGNNNLKWQRTVTHNFGLDVQFFAGRLNLNVDYQMRDTDPLLVRIDMPTSTGAGDRTDERGSY